MSKDEAVFDLKNNWDALDPAARKERVNTLLGHRVKLITIAQLIGRPVDEVRSAYKTPRSTGIDNNKRIEAELGRKLVDMLDPAIIRDLWNSGVFENLDELSEEFIEVRCPVGCCAGRRVEIKNGPRGLTTISLFNLEYGKALSFRMTFWGKYKVEGLREHLERLKLIEPKTAEIGGK